MQHITLAICTKDRPDDLKRLLESIEKQTRLADDIIIIDGSDNPVKSVVEKFEKLPIRYTEVRPPSLPRQRNVAISMIQDHSNWVGFLDDDLVLENDSVEQIEKTIETSETEKTLGGVGLTIINVPNTRYKLSKAFFLLDNSRYGFFTTSGLPGMLHKTDEIRTVEWLSGGVTFWKAELLAEFKFDEWFEGTGYLEDVEFSYRASRKYSLIYCGPAKCFHFSHPVPLTKMKDLGVWQITAWWYFIKKFNDFNIIAVFWSMTGVILNNAVCGTINPSSHRLRKFFGNIQGLAMVLTGNALKRRTWHK